MFGCKKRTFFDDFDTDFDSKSDTSDDNNVREFGFIVDQHISDHFDDKTSGDECSVMGDNLFCSFFNPVISLCIYYDQYEKYGENTQKFFPAVGFHGNGGHIRF